MNNEVEHLRGLLEACDRVLPELDAGEARGDELAEAIRETCRNVEARLAELGLSYANGSVSPS
jgi:hypothetical protein